MRERFAKIPLRTMSDSDMTARRFRVLVAIASHDGGRGCYAYQSTLAKETGLRREHVSREISWLAAAGYLSIEKAGRRRILRVVHDGGSASPYGPNVVVLQQAEAG